MLLIQSFCQVFKSSLRSRYFGSISGLSYDNVLFIRTQPRDVTSNREKIWVFVVRTAVFILRKDDCYFYSQKSRQIYENLDRTHLNTENWRSAAVVKSLTKLWQSKLSQLLIQWLKPLVLFQMLFLDHISRHLTNHNRRCICITRHKHWHSVNKLR